jgi:hypothetical protein
MPNYTGYQRAGIVAYVGVSALAIMFLYLHFKHKDEDDYADGYVAWSVTFYVISIIATLEILIGR